ncbi:MAG: AMP-binding protein [Proteobacteria bacterium]|nr:AMP-binding protein [Pseudomonadota bacterium]
MSPTTVYEVFAHSLARSPDAPFLFVEPVTAKTYGIASQTLSYGAAAERIGELKQKFQAAGYGPGHRVGLLLANRPSFFLHWFALNALGVSVVPISTEMRRAEWAYLIGHSGMCLAVCLADRVTDLTDAAGDARREFADATPQFAAVVEELEVGLPRAPAVACAPASPLDRECALLYTSGTTGRPKGCRLSNAYFLNCGRWYTGVGGLCEVRPGRERVITPLPLSHMNAMAVSAMMAVTSGGCIVQLDRFHPGSWWQSVRDSGATIVHYLGVMPAMLLAAAPDEKDRAHAVRFGFGAGVDPAHHAVFEQRFGFPLLEAWAMTETGSAATVIANREPRHVGTKCFGRAESFMELRLVDEQGVDVPAGQPGELLVRSAGTDPRRHFFSGYLKDEAATEQAWEGDWFHTGDVVRQDKDGYLYFVDRRKNVIRRSGENISAVEVESVLNRHPAVRASGVAGTPDPLRGDEVLACIVTHQSVPIERRAALAAEIVAHALSQLAYYKAPGYVAFVDALPLTSSQKIQRAALKEMAAALPSQAHCVDVRGLKKRTA